MSDLDIIGLEWSCFVMFTAAALTFNVHEAVLKFVILLMLHAARLKGAVRSRWAKLGVLEQFDYASAS